MFTSVFTLIGVLSPNLAKCDLLFPCLSGWMLNRGESASGNTVSQAKPHQFGPAVFPYPLQPSYPTLPEQVELEFPFLLWWPLRGETIFTRPWKEWEPRAEMREGNCKGTAELLQFAHPKLYIFPFDNEAERKSANKWSEWRTFSFSSHPIVPSNFLSSNNNVINFLFLRVPWFRRLALVSLPGFPLVLFIAYNWFTLRAPFLLLLRPAGNDKFQSKSGGIPLPCQGGREWQVLAVTMRCCASSSVLPPHPSIMFSLKGDRKSMGHYGRDHLFPFCPFLANPHCHRCHPPTSICHMVSLFPCQEFPNTSFPFLYHKSRVEDRDPFQKGINLFYPVKVWICSTVRNNWWLSLFKQFGVSVSATNFVLRNYSLGQQRCARMLGTEEMKHRHWQQIITLYSNQILLYFQFA